MDTKFKLGEIVFFCEEQYVFNRQKERFEQKVVIHCGQITCIGGVLPKIVYWIKIPQRLIPFSDEEKMSRDLKDLEKFRK